MKLYPRFCRTIADQYLVFHSRGQRAAQVRLLFRVHAISQYFDENNMINELKVEDKDFNTEINQRNDRHVMKCVTQKQLKMTINTRHHHLAMR